jgi:hypothetical protein
MRALKICLWTAGILCLLSVFGMFLPVTVVESIAKAFGAGAFPDSPVVPYVLRVISATYVAVGAYFIILALHPEKYAVLVPFTGLAAVFLGLVCAVTGLAVAIPLWWLLGDALSCAVLGVLILVFWRQAKQTTGGLADTTQSDRPE